MTAQPASDWAGLADDDVHVWHAPLNLDAVSVDGLARTLAPDERMRTTRFTRDTDRRRFVTARGIARVLLGGYLGRPPAAIRFVYGRNGKPEVAVTSGRPAIRFNYAHSGDRMLLGIRRGGGMYRHRRRGDPASHRARSAQVLVASGHVAALATEGDDPHVCAWELNDDAMGVIVGAASYHPLVPLLSPP